MPPIPGNGILAATVPGVFDGLMLALEKYGTMSVRAGSRRRHSNTRSRDSQCRRSFASTSIDAACICAVADVRSQFFEPNGKEPQPGEIFREPDTARTLRATDRRREEGAWEARQEVEAVRDYFYRGQLAQRIADFSEHNGGLIRYEDMKAYHAELDTPRTTKYRGYEVNKPGFWTQGPVMLEALNILEGYRSEGDGA